MLSRVGNPAPTGSLRAATTATLVLTLAACSPGGGDGSTGASTSGGASSSSSSSSSGGVTASGPVSVQILALNDFHGHLQPPPGGNGQVELPSGARINAGGAVHLAAHVAAYRAVNPNTLVVSAGDLIGASPLVSGLFHDEPTVEAMNLLGLSVNGVGNHEFDEGQDELLRMQNGGCHPTDGCTTGHDFGGAAFPILSANVRRGEAGPTLLAPYSIHRFEGLPVAFIGITLEGTPAIVNPAGVAGLVFQDEADAANALVPELRAQGVEAIFVLLHEGGYQTGTYDDCTGISGPVVDIVQRLDPAIDAVFSGHTHQAYNCVIGGRVVTSAASFGRVVTRAEVVLDHISHDVLSMAAVNEPVLRDASDDAMAALVQQYVDAASSQADRVVGSITQTLRRYPPQGGGGLSTMGVTVANAQLWATRAPEDGGAQLAITNPGGVRADLNLAAAAGEVGSGQVRYAELYEVQPFGNDLILMDLTGAQLRTLFESQLEDDGMGGVAATILHVSDNVTYTIQVGNAAGSRVPLSGIQVDGVPLVAGALYRVAVNSYLAGGGDGFGVFTQGTNLGAGPVELDALVRYFQANSPVSAPDITGVRVQ